MKFQQNFGISATLGQMIKTFVEIFDLSTHNVTFEENFGISAT